MKRRLNRRQTIALGVTVAVLVAAVALAWSLDLLTQSSDKAYTVSVVRDEDVIHVFDLAALKVMKARKIEMQGEIQKGPPLLDVLKAAGVDEFSSLTITGTGVRDSGRIVLDADEVDRDVLLDFSNRGTVKVCGPDILWENRVRDVMRIEVR